MESAVIIGCTLSSVTDYGEVKTAWPDRKVSNALTNLLKDTGQLWDLPIKQQLWVLPSENSKQIWVFDYIRGIWTKFEFPFKAIYATCVDNLVYFFSNTGDIYELNDGYIQDDLYEDGKQDIEAKLRLGTLTLLTMNNMQVRMMTLYFQTAAF